MTDPFTLVLVFIAAAFMVAGAIVGGIIMSVRASNTTAPVHHLPVDNTALTSRGTPDPEAATPEPDTDHGTSTAHPHKIAS